MSSNALEIFELDGSELDAALQSQLEKKERVLWVKERRCVLCDDNGDIEVYKNTMFFSSMNLKFVTDVALPLCRQCKDYFFNRT